MVARPCRGNCGRLVTPPASRCPTCQRGENTRQHNPQYDATWRRISKRMVAEWIREHGPWCPGDPPEHDAHPSWDLTVDHGEQAGVASRLLDRSRLRVMCRSRNAVLGRRG